MNKLLRYLGYIGVYILVILEVFFVSLLLSSPLLYLVISILDIANCIPAMLTGKYLILWLITSSVFSIPMFIYVIINGDIKTKKKRKASKDKAEPQSEQQK